MNLVTPARRLAAVREVTEGIAFSLSLPLDFPGGKELVPGRRAPRIKATRRATGQLNYNFCFSCQNHSLFDVVSDDAVTIWTQYSSQWDALAHWGQEIDAEGYGVPEVVHHNDWRADEHLLGPDQEGEPMSRKLGYTTFMLDRSPEANAIAGQIGGKAEAMVVDVARKNQKIEKFRLKQAMKADLEKVWDQEKAGIVLKL